MKVKTFRYTGNPVNVDELESYKNEWRTLFDKAEKKCGPDMLRMQKLLARCERLLGKKYKTVQEWDFMDTAEAWKEKLEEYGNIMVTTHVETGEILYCIRDEEETLY